MHSLFLCTHDADVNALRRTLAEPAERGAVDLPREYSVHRIPTRPAAAAARAGALIGSQAGDDPALVTVVVRTDSSSVLSRVSHALCAGDRWFADITLLEGRPLVSLEDTAAAWAFAAACALLPPEHVCGFAGSEAEVELCGVAQNHERRLRHIIRSSVRRFSPPHVAEAEQMADAIAESGRLTASQKILLGRAAAEAAVRLGSVPEQLRSLSPGWSSSQERNLAVTTLIETLRRADSESA